MGSKISNDVLKINTTIFDKNSKQLIAVHKKDIQ